jgi:hypothetical protein
MTIVPHRNIQRSASIMAGLAAIALLAFAAAPAAAQQWTPQQRAACEPDAHRLCGQYIPDVERITACMNRNRRYLSPACRRLFR